ncbi:hypothetical protein Droror1_Dr00027167 [Drosera rotundifolia]
MGNCLFAGEGGGDGGSDEALIQVINCNGGIMEFHPPITAGCILSEFLGHSIYRADDDEEVDSFWKPLQHEEELHSGKRYYLLPWAGQLAVGGGGRSHARCKSIPMMAGDSNIPVAMPIVSAATAVAPYRMSVEYESHVLKRSYTEVFSRRRHKKSKNNGVWKVKLVIKPGQLVDILSQEALTEDLIENGRRVANCWGVSMSSMVSTGDQLSSVSDRSVASCSTLD